VNSINRTVTPIEPAWAGIALDNSRLAGLAGLNSTAMSLIAGKVPRRISTNLGITSWAKFARPVVFPPGRARLAISPCPTGSMRPVITIGIVELARCAARAALIVVTTIAAGLRWTTSAASV
jgi:hypothetical protein